MKKNIYCLPLLLLSSICYAEPNVKCSSSCSVVTTDFTILAGGLGVNTSRPADSLSYKNFIWGSASIDAKVCGSNSANYDLGRIRYIPNLIFVETVTPLGFAPRNLFKSNHDAYYMSYTYLSNRLFNTDLMNSYDMKVASVGDRAGDVYNGRLVNMLRVSDYYTKIPHTQALYKAASRETAGQFLFSSILGNPIITYECYDTSNVLKEITRIHAQPIPAQIVVRTCSVGQKLTSVEMPPVSLQALNSAAIGDPVGYAEKQFHLSCDQDISVYASLVDLNDTSNRSNVAKLTSLTSSATGVGFKVFFNGKAYNFGVDNSSAFTNGNNNGDVDRFLVGRSGDHDSYDINYSLRFTYTRTAENPTSGTAQAMIGITYSYQ